MIPKPSFQFRCCRNPITFFHGICIHYKRSLQAAKKGKTLTFHWRGGYLTKEVLRELLDLIEKAGKERQKTALIKLNWPQAVLRVRYTDEPIQPVVTMEEANEGEETPEGTASL